MSRARSVGVRRPPGPVEGDVPCADCPTDGHSAVYRIPDPRFDISTTSALCPYHLAVIKREYPKLWADLRSHPQLPDPEEFIQRHALIERRDLPSTITVDGDQYDRLGLDRLGAGYYARECLDGQIRVLEVDHTFAVQESTLVRDDQLGALFDHVDRENGWRGIEDEWIDRVQARADGGESA